MFRTSKGSIFCYPLLVFMKNQFSPKFDMIYYIISFHNTTSNTFTWQQIIYLDMSINVTEINSWKPDNESKWFQLWNRKLFCMKLTEESIQIRPNVIYMWQYESKFIQSILLIQSPPKKKQVQVLIRCVKQMCCI